MNDTLLKIARALLMHTLREWPYCATHGKTQQIMSIKVTSEDSASIMFTCEQFIEPGGVLTTHVESVKVRLTPAERERIVIAQGKPNYGDSKITVSAVCAGATVSMTNRCYTLCPDADCPCHVDALCRHVSLVPSPAKDKIKP